MFKSIISIIALIQLVRSFTSVTIGTTGSGADYECDGVDDDVEFQKAICQIKGETYDETLTYSEGYDSCGFKHPGLEADPYSGLGEGLITIEEGTYNINRQLWVYSNIEMTGAGMDDTILRLADGAVSFYQKYSEAGGWVLEGGQSGFLRVYFADNVTISHLTLDGNKDGQTTSTIDDEYDYGRFALYTEASLWIDVNNCRVKNWQGYGLDPHGVGGDDVYGEHLSITYNEVHDNDWDGITLDKSRYVTCSHNNVYDNGRHGINIVTGTEEANIHDNVLSNNGHYYEKDGSIQGKGCGIMAQNNQLFGTSDVNIYDNIVSGSNYAGICLHSVYSFEVYRNTITGTENWCIRLALQSENTLGSYNNKIYENTCEYERGIYITKDSYNNQVYDNIITGDADTYGVSNRDEDYSSATNKICGNTYSGSISTGYEVYYNDGKYAEIESCDGSTPEPTPTPTEAPTVPGQTPAPTESPTPAPTLASDPDCSNGIINGDVCCMSSCGTCGGSGCSSRDGGGDGCCTSKIRSAGDSCEDGPAPCVIQPSSGGDPDPTCSTGILSGSVCCESGCGSCGGSGCSSRPGGASSCCSSTIKSDSNSCDSNPPPCVM